MTIRPIPKPRKTKSKRVGYWNSKADAVFQNIGRMTYEDTGCLICSGEYSCLHHIVLKSKSTFLRYKWRNVIPICGKDHFNIHSTDLTEAKKLLEQVIEIKGQDWYDNLMVEKDSNKYMNAGYTYYRDMFYRLQKITPMEIESLDS